MARSESPSWPRSGSPLAAGSEGGRSGPPRASAALLGGVVLLLVVGCAGPSSSDSGSATSGRARGPGVAAPLAAADGGSEKSGLDVAQATAGGQVPLVQRRQVRTGDLTVMVPDVADAVTTVRQVALRAKGFVADEQTTTRIAADGGTSPARGSEQPEAGDRSTAARGSAPVVVDRSVLTLRVPEQSLEQVMDEIASVGTMRGRHQSSQDVTDAYVDVQSRLRTQRESVARVQALLSKANTIGDVVKVEAELTRRQADLESLEGRLAAMQDSTTLATLTVDLVPDPTRAGARAEPREGFLGGLSSGWHALTAATVVASRVAGAVLPFAVLALIVAVPVRIRLRRRRRTPEPAA